MESLVTPEWLAAELGAADLRVLDASFFLPGSGRDGAAEFKATHIPGAAFFDIDRIADLDDPAPHMLPDERSFAAEMAAIGVSERDRIVVYDNSPLHSAARAWWMLRSFGARQVALLDGGLAVWRAAGHPVESGPAQPRQARFSGALSRKQLVAKPDVLGSGAVIVDARGPGRFAGAEPEPRPGVAAGHIPGSRNLPQDRLFETDGRWKRGDALRSAFAEAGVNLTKPMITTCGSGVTAAVLLFGAHLLGKEDVRLYDGSWSEWGADPVTPKATGAA